MNMRKTTSLTMLISLVLMLVTSIILYIVPHGRVAYWADWHFLCLTKSQWGNIHINLGFLFLLAGFLHILYNWKPMIAYMKNKAGELKIFTTNFNLALIVTLVVTIGTLLNVPPMSTVINFSESIKDAASEKYGEPPYNHAELSSLKLFTKKMNINLYAAQQLLTREGIQLTDEKQTIGDIARANKLSPRQVYDIIKPAEVKTEAGAAFPDSPPSGFGKKQLSEIFITYGFDVQATLSALAEKGIKADPAMNMKDIAAEHGTNPHALFEILHEAAQK